MSKSIVADLINSIIVDNEVKIKHVRDDGGVEITYRGKEFLLAVLHTHEGLNVLEKPSPNLAKGADKETEKHFTFLHYSYILKELYK